MTATIHHGDCLDVLRAMPDNSVDAIVCDPPYGLSNTSPDKVTDTIARWATGDRDAVPSTKSGFMGAGWDAFVPPPAVWDECFRVLKPGGHLLAFAGARTQDLMGISVRMAGFDIRDSISWIAGSGFPKSHDISKGIDKLNGRKFEDRYALGRHIRDRRVTLGLTPADVNAWFGYKDGCQHWERQDASGARVPTLADWAILKPRLGLSDEHLAIVERVEAEREVVATKAKRDSYGAGAGNNVYGGGPDHQGIQQITAPGTPSAEKWSGWGTALKPSHEPVIVARKPLSEKTVAANVLTWGTGGLNIDATRVTPLTDAEVARSGKSTNGGVYGKYDSVDWKTEGKPHQGRWPANVVLDPDTAKALDQQSGTSKDGVAVKRNKNPEAFESNDVFGKRRQLPQEDHGYKGEGGASRFFKVVEPNPPFMYAAKAPKKERPTYTTEDGQTVQHATVKPLSIMQWLVKLVTPEGGTVLDPFAGSGTTVEAAILERFNVIGIEREEAYLPLIQQRIDRANDVLPMAS